MKKILISALSIVTLAVSGCNQIYYHNGTASVANKSMAEYNEWHHVGVFGIVEFSPPIDIKGHCPRGWDTIQTENSFLSGLVSGVTYSLYTPREANLVCK